MTEEEMKARIAKLERELAAAEKTNITLSARMGMVEKRAREKFEASFAAEMQKLGVGEKGAAVALRLQRAAITEKTAGYGLVIEDDGELAFGDAMVGGKRAANVAELAKLLVEEHTFLRGDAAPAQPAQARQGAAQRPTKKLSEMSAEEAWAYQDAKNPETPGRSAERRPTKSSAEMTVNEAWDHAFDPRGGTSAA